MVEIDPMGVFDGVMLSDGAIVPTPASFRFHMSLTGRDHMDWLHFIKDSLDLLGVDCSEPSVRTMTYRGSPKEYSYLCSRTSEFLVEQRQRWYPEGRKEVPMDFTFIPVSLANEFMGDGSSNWYKNPRGQKLYVYVYLHTYAYSQDSIELLLTALSTLEISGKWSQYVKGNARSGARKGLQLSSIAGVWEFMDTVEPHILPSYRYKIKRVDLKELVPTW